MWAWLGMSKRLSIEQQLLMAHRRAVALQQELREMALKVDVLQAAVVRLTAAVEALISAHSDPAGQAAVDAVAQAMNDEAAKAEAAVAPPAPPADVPPAA